MIQNILRRLLRLLRNLRLSLGLVGGRLLITTVDALRKTGNNTMVATPYIFHCLEDRTLPAAVIMRYPEQRPVRKEVNASVDHRRKD